MMIPADLAGLPLTCKYCDGRFTAPFPSYEAEALAKERAEEEARRQRAAASERERQEREEIDAAARKMRADDAARHARDMGQSPQRSDIAQLLQELVKIRESTDSIPTIKVIMMFFVVLFLVGCCVAFVLGTGGR